MTGWMCFSFTKMQCWCNWSATPEKYMCTLCFVTYCHPRYQWDPWCRIKTHRGWMNSCCCRLVHLLSVCLVGLTSVVSGFFLCQVHWNYDISCGCTGNQWEWMMRFWCLWWQMIQFQNGAGGKLSYMYTGVVLFNEMSSWYFKCGYF